MAEVWERPEQTARLLAREIPLDARLVALVHGAEDAVAAARAADAIAAGVARRREHILLASCEASPAALDELVGGADAPGFGAALRGEARLTETAVRREDRLYIYLPAGRRPSRPEEVVSEEAMASFVHRVRERGGTLLIFGPDRLLEVDSFARLLDGYVSLGTVSVRPDPALMELARLRFHPPTPDRSSDAAEAGEPAAEPTESVAKPTEPTPEPANALVGVGSERVGVWRRKAGAWHDLSAPPGPAADPAEESGSPAEEAKKDASKWRRHRKRPGFPYARVAAALAIVAGLSVGWWVVAQTATSSAPLGAEPGESPDPSLPAVDRRALLSAVGGAEELPYSVLIASYAAAGDARERVDRLRRAGDGLFFIAPTPVRGAIYHRVFAGARTGAADGRSLMAELVEAGRKEAVSDWDVRPAGLAYRLGIFASSEEAGETAEELESRGVPAYVLPAGAGEVRAWQVYAGAYESEAAARPLAAILERAGLRAELVARRGEVR